MFKKGSRYLAAFIFGAIVTVPAYADWHAGAVTQLDHSYDGTITFVLANWSRNNCTCNAAWPNQMCLDRTRVSFKEEYAWLLRTRTTGQSVSVNIDEASCKVIALFESD